MEKTKKRKFFLIKASILSIIILFWWTIAYAIDSVSDYIKTNSSTSFGSNNSKITFSNNLLSYYVNKNNDHIIVWDYFKWYYYDSVYWYFKFNWNNDRTKNVSFVWTTDKCSSWEWYKIWWYAYSKYAWYIKFDYDNNNYVYYCKNDNKLHWYGYSKHLWFQSFEWIVFKIAKTQRVAPNINDEGNFANDTDKIDEELNSWWAKTIWGWDKYEIDNAKVIESTWSLKNNESIFWIIK